MIRPFGIVLLTLFLVAESKAQILLPGYYHSDYYDLLLMKNDGLNEPITYHPSLIHAYQSDSALSWDIWEGRFAIEKEEGDYIRPVNPHVRFSYINYFPDVYNDGAVWEGKGFNSSAHFGFTGKKGKFNFTFAPVVYYAQNKDFDIPAGPFVKNPFQYPFERKIDWVMRYGDDAYSQFHPGQSELRFTHNNTSIGISTQSMVWGSGRVTPILMSNNAGGIPHLDIGTATPVMTGWGKVEFKVFWGIMNESDYFDSNTGNDQRYLTGALLGFEPKFAPGLSIGVQRVMYREMFDGDFQLTDLFAALWKADDDPNLPNDNYDQMASLNVRWRFKEYGFDAYAEIARNDFPGTITDLFENPDRALATTIGLVKTFDNEDGSIWRFVLEQTSLTKRKLSIAAPAGHPTYYVHSLIENGYTDNGQLMGAYIGPGSNSFHLRIQYYGTFGMVSGNLDHVRYNDDYFAENFTGTPVQPQDARYRYGIDYVKFVNNFSVYANLTYGRIRNLFYLDEIAEDNWSASLRIGYLLHQR